DYSDMDDYISHDFNFLTYCSRLYLYSALFSKDKYFVQQSNIYQIYLQLFSGENLNEINDERVKKMVLSLKDSIFNLIVNPFGEAMKFVSLPYKFNLKDEFKQQVLSSPFMEDKKGVYLYSSDSVVKKDKIESLRDDIENYIGCSVSIYAEKGYIFVCKGGFSDKAFESIKSSPVLDKTTVNNGYIYYGVTSDGVKIGRSIEDDKHLLLVGQSGSGKSVLQQALIYQLKNNIEYIDEMILVDLKGGVEFFQHQGDKISVVYEIEKLADVVGGLVETVRNRLDYMRENGLKNYDGKKIYLMIDEYAQIAYHKPLGREQKEIHNSLLTNLNKLSTLGRACGVRLICGLQKCTTSEMDSGFKNNLHDRIIMKSNSNLIFSEVFGTSDFGEGVKLPKPSKFKAGEMLAWIDGERVPSHVKGFLINE
ncbi:FtsK/SpoIIIE domain-containing protein, partial [Vibrio rotiferianus]|uniref:FtsK/SpoIIIE domain-containing protein n=3 Tax=Vibrio rotiferianus TaxID=190895 RepID=UPI001D125D7C